LLIVDESQNMNLQEAKALLTRMGENSKIVLLGDLNQIDSAKLDSSTSGLGIIIEKFKDFDLAGHITLIKGERSALATHAAKIL
jgi:PhoH-like ATPase